MPFVPSASPLPDPIPATGTSNLARGKDEAPRPVLEFKEKPDLETAKTYLAGGDYPGNAGIFIWRAKVILDAFRENAADIYELLSRGKGLYNTAEEQDFINENYPKSRRISVDFAIMESAKNVFTLPADIGGPTSAPGLRCTPKATRMLLGQRDPKQPATPARKRAKLPHPRTQRQTAGAA